MSVEKQNKIPWIYTSILYICGFFLFLEWLYPVEEITETSNLTVFIIFTLFCFCISMLQMNLIFSFLLKGFGLLFIINGLFFNQSFFSKLWLNQLYLELTSNIHSLFQQQWYEVTPLFRSMLFLLLIWLMSYLIHYWFVVTKRIFLFILLTFIYVATLNTFTDYNGALSIIRTFVIGFIAMGMANFFREMDGESVHFPRGRKTVMWVAPLIAVVLLTSVIGYASPTYNPQWPDPVPFLKDKAENVQKPGGDSTVHKVGYGEDDSQLGGSFVQDYRPVFQATAEEEHYWRIETKDVYTGKGWKASASPDYQAQQAGLISLETFSSDVETEELQTTLDFTGNTNIEKLVYPYGIQQVSTNEGAQFLLDENSGEIRTQINNKDVSLENYTITYDKPSFAIDELRAANEADPDNIASVYTKLPPALPSRVDELAEEITASYNNRYDKAHAIEQYFGRNGFVYQISNVPVPGEDQDYVDQFLFDSKAGYCDNYSTSMVVMLRTLDIPARWAKGFTSGERIAEQSNGTNVYEVTSANAHSWVEVYFPEIGWVPFEPTQGFSNLSDYHVTENRNEDEADVEEEKDEATEREPNPPEGEEGVETPEDTKVKKADYKNWVYVGVGTFIVIVLFTVLYVTRFRWLTSFYAMKLARKGDVKAYQDAYHHLLNVLQHKGIVKAHDETLRAYAERIDRHYGTNEMGQLTNYYEQVLYNNEKNTPHVADLTQLWKNLIKRVMG